MQNWNIRSQLLVLVLAATLPFLTLIALLIWQDAVDLRAAGATNTLSIARQISARIDEQVVAIDTMLGTIGATVGSDLNAIAANDIHLRAMLADMPDMFADLMVHTPDGQTLNSATLSVEARRELETADLENDRSAIKKNSLSISKPVYSPSTKKWTVIFSKPLMGSDGKIRAVISIAILVDHFQNLLLAAGLPPQSLVTLVDAGGLVLAHTLDPTAWVSRDLSRLPAYVDASRLGEGSGHMLSADGVTRLSGFATGRRAPWMVYVGIPTDVVYADSRAKLIRCTIITMIAMLIAALLAAFLSRRIVQPVVSLRKGTAELAAGQYDQRLTVSGAGEIDGLAADFNHLADTLEKAQAAQGEAERRYRDMIDNVDLLAVMLDLEGRITLCNDFLLKQTGWSEAEVLGRSWFDVFIAAADVQTRAVLRNKFMASVTNDTFTRHVETEIVCRDGSRRFVHWNNSILRLPSGIPIGTVSIGEDITERRRATLAEGALHRRVKTILENMTDGFVALDREWRFTYVNARAAEMLGRSAESLLGKKYLDEYPQAAGTPFAAAYQKVMAENIAMQIEDYYAVWDRWFENWIYPSPDGISIFFHDITDRKVAEQKVTVQIEELKRWYHATIDREDRVRQLKGEVNALRARLGEPPRYDSPTAPTLSNTSPS